MELIFLSCQTGAVSVKVKVNVQLGKDEITGQWRSNLKWMVKINVKCEMQKAKASGQQSQQESQKHDAGREESQIKNAHFWTLSL